MYRVLPEAQSRFLQACVFTAQELDASIISRSTANGFITKDGRNVIQAAPPQHRGRKFYCKKCVFSIFLVFLYKLTEYQLLEREDIKNIQTLMKFTDDVEIPIAIPLDLALYWRVNSLFYYSPTGT